jgi:hypothetical protein
MLSKIGVIVLGALLAVGFFGCYKNNTANPLQPESQLDKNWGRSFEAAKHNQILNREAEKNLAPVEGVDGVVEERIMEGYIKGGDQKKQGSSEFGVLTIKK